jgi:hypothetical protein
MCVLLLVVVSLLGLFGRDSCMADTERPRREIYCGPRAVQRVLRHYGKSADLIALIQEMKWSRNDEGTSFEELSWALQRRGVYSKSVRVPDFLSFEWKHPAILQIDLNDRKHFVVWLPPTQPGQHPTVWDGAQSADVLAGQIGGLEGGAILLTAPEEIRDFAPESHETSVMLSTPAIVILGCLAFATGLFLPMFRFWRRDTTAPRSKTDHISVIPVIAFFTLAPVLTASTPSTDVSLEVLAIRDNARGLLNGKAVARGTIRFELRDENAPKNPARIVECEEVLEFAFDYAANRISFQRRRERIAGDGFPQLDDFQLAGLVSTPELSLQISQTKGSLGHSVGIYEPIVDWKRLPRYLDPVVDIRVVSLASYDSLFGPFEDFATFLESDAITVTDEGGGIRRLQGSDDTDLTYRYWTDERVGLQVVRQQTTRDEQAYQSRGLRVPVVSESETTWTQINGTWIPVSLTMQTRARLTTTRLQLTFDWQSVNQGVTDDAFDWQAWDLPSGAFVVDQRLGRDKSIYLRDFSMPDEVQFPIRPKSTTVRRQRIMILGNVIVAGLVAGWFVNRCFFGTRR